MPARMRYVVGSGTTAHWSRCSDGAAMLRAELTRVVERLRDLVWQARERRRGTGPTLRPIGGGSDAAFLTAILASATLCGDCIARKAGLPPSRIPALLTVIGRTLRVTVAAGRCDACLEQKTITSLDTPVDPTAPPPAPPRTASHELWRFLEAHPGEMFCTQCLTRELGGTARFDRAVIAAEGRGATRRQGACASCGKRRLVCGLPRS